MPPALGPPAAAGIATDMEVAMIAAERPAINLDVFIAYFPPFY